MTVYCATLNMQLWKSSDSDYVVYTLPLLPHPCASHHTWVTTPLSLSSSSFRSSVILIGTRRLWLQGHGFCSYNFIRFANRARLLLSDLNLVNHSRLSSTLLLACCMNGLSLYLSSLFWSITPTFGVSNAALQLSRTILFSPVLGVVSVMFSVWSITRSLLPPTSI